MFKRMFKIMARMMVFRLVISALISFSIPVGASRPSVPATTLSSGQVFPVGEQLTEKDLSEYTGEWAPIAAGAIVSLGYYTLNTWDQPKDLGWYTRAATATLSGAPFGFTGSSLVAAASTQIGKTAATVYSAGSLGAIEWGLSR